MPEAPTKKKVVSPEPPTTIPQMVDRDVLQKKPVADEGTRQPTLSSLTVVLVISNLYILSYSNFLNVCLRFKMLVVK